MLNQPEGYIVCAKGGPSPYPASFMHQDGVQFHLDKERVDFTVLLQRPTDKEIYDFSKGRAQFALCVSGPVIFLLSKFGDQPWSEAPYSANLLSSELRGMPEGYQPGMRIGMTLMLIDSSANIIKGLRYLTLSAKLSEALAKEIKKQMRSPVSRSAYEKAIADAYVRHPTARSMKKNAIIVSSDRFAEEMQSREQVDAKSQSSSECESEAAACMAQPDALEHITLNTGHVRLSPREEAGQLTVDVCRDLIALSTSSNAHVPIQACEPYVVKISVDGSNMLATVSEIVAKTLIPVVTIGVAIDADSGVGLWKEMHSSANMPLVTKADSSPKRPWIAARLEFKRTFFSSLAAMLWIGDFERCLGFAFVDYLNLERPLTH